MFDDQNDQSRWRRQREALTALFRTRTRDEWAAIFGISDACAAPVLTMADALSHPHNRARGTFIEVGAFTQPAPAPRYSRTPCDQPTLPPVPGTDDAILAKGTPEI